MQSTPDRAVSVFEALSRRRMVRNYLPDPVDPSHLQRVIESAHHGPSAGNTRSLELLVLDEAEVALYWATTLPPEVRDDFPWPGLLIAPVLLIPYVRPASYADRYREADKARTGLGDGLDAWTVPYWWVDGGAAVENILLSAVALGLGACLFGQFEHEPAVRATFGVPDDYRAIGTVALGHRNPDGDRSSLSSRRPRRDLDEITHRGRW